MKTTTAEILETHSDELETYYDYSGRGMYGEETTAIVGDREDLYNSLSSILRYGDEWERKEVAEALEHLRSDSMGRQMIFY